MNPTNPNKNAMRGVSLFLSLFTLIGLIVLGAGVWNLVRSVRCESWPTVEGVVLSSQMELHRGNKGGMTYSASIGYDYMVGRTHYNGTRVAFGSMSASAAYAQVILNRFPVGKKVPVSYSPGNPQDSVLEPGIHGGTWICFGVGSLFMLAGMMFRQIAQAAQRAPLNAIPGVASGGDTGMQRPPLLMGVIFILTGSFVAIGATTSGGPKWLICGAFILAGLFLLKKSLEKDEVD